MPRMIIASRLSDGLVVFFTADRQWADSIEEGALLDDGAAEQLLAAAKEDEASCRVVEPYVIEVRVDGGRRRPAEIREVIRAFGPSVRTEVLDAPPK